MMQRPAAFETMYAHDRRPHRHRCLRCSKIIDAGMPVLMWRLNHKISRAVHIGCADEIAVPLPNRENRPATWRDVARGQAEEFAIRLGFKRQEASAHV